MITTFSTFALQLVMPIYLQRLRVAADEMKSKVENSAQIIYGSGFSMPVTNQHLSRSSSDRSFPMSTKANGYSKVGQVNFNDVHLTFTCSEKFAHGTIEEDYNPSYPSSCVDNDGTLPCL